MMKHTAIPVFMPERRKEKGGIRTMRSFLRRLLLLIMLFVLAAFPLLSVSAEPLQDCHRVTNTFEDTKQANKSQVRLWHIETAHPAVTAEINALAEAWRDELAPGLPKAANTTGKNSRLDVEISYSRTGLRWMSFLVQARVQYHRKVTEQRLAARTYDMITGERVLLADLFGDNENAWTLLAGRVRQELTSYFPDEKPDEQALTALCSRESLEKADFTLHGMSLVLHYPASLLYPEHHTLMHVTFFYPEIRSMMTEAAFAETDNLKYYKTCALTFDDGPSSSNTPRVLNALMETGARATFFVIGNRVKDYQYLVQKEHDNGHAVASHNWHHGNVNKSSYAALRAMPKKVNAVMTAAIGIPVRYDRVPAGRYPRMIKAKAGWAYIQWSLDTYDWRGGPTSGVMEKVRKLLHDGDIILCHDIKDNTPESARQIVHYLEEQGYLPLTVDELFAKDGVVLEPNKVYYRCDQGETSIRKD